MRVIHRSETISRRFEFYEDSGGGLHLYDVAYATMYSGFEVGDMSPLESAAVLVHEPDTASTWTLACHTVLPHEIGNDERLILVMEFPETPGLAGRRSMMGAS